MFLFVFPYSQLQQANVGELFVTVMQLQLGVSQKLNLTHPRKDTATATVVEQHCLTKRGKSDDFTSVCLFTFGSFVLSVKVL